MQLSYANIHQLDEERQLVDVIQEISERYQIIFTYDAQSVQDVKITITEGDFSSLNLVFEKIVEQTNLGIKFLGTKYYVLYKNDSDGKKSMRKLKRKINQIQSIESSGKISLQTAVKSPQAIKTLQSKVLELAGIDIQGRVINEEGEALIGVNVLVKGTDIGTSTDFDGGFQLSDVDENAVLSLSYIGYQTLEVPVEGRSDLIITLVSDAELLDELVVVGYGTVKKSDLTGSVNRLNADNFKNQNVTQIGEFLTGTVAGFSANQSSSPQGGSSLEVRGPTSLTAGTSPMIVLDGVIYNGSLQDINPTDIETIDVLKDASSAAIYGAKAASGVILITTTKGNKGKPRINYSSKLGVSTPTVKREAYSPQEYIDFRADYFRTINPTQDYNYYTDPNNLPSDIGLDEWINLSQSPLPDVTDEYLRRLNFFPIEQEQFKAGQTTNWYDEVYRTAVRQTHDLSIGGGSDRTTYYWSLGYVDNEGLRLGDKYSAIRSRMNAEYEVSDWLNVGINAQFTDRDEGGVPASYDIYSNSPFGRVFDADGNLERLAHGHTFNPLLDYYRDDKFRKVNSLFANLYADVKLPLGITYRLSFQPRYETMKELYFRSTDVKLGGDPAQDNSMGSRSEYSSQEWIIDNILKWNKEVGIHFFDVTLLHSSEKNQFWSTSQFNQNVSPNEELGFHGLQFGDNPSIDNNDRKFTGEAFMARLNYTLMDKYLLTLSVRRDGFSAFGQDEPRATFPAAAAAWQISREGWYNEESFVNRLKLRLSWGSNGNRDIGIYSALATLDSDLWFDGTNARVGLYNLTLANSGLVWEKTRSFNIGMDMGLMDDRFDLSIDIYDATTTNLLMNRLLPSLTGFSNVTTNLGRLNNKGLELTLGTNIINNSNLHWKSNFVFSFNRNKILELFGDKGDYTLLGEVQNGELPDYTNQWFPGYAIDAVWDYEVIGVWQEGEEDQAAQYVMRPGDFKSVDVNNDGEYIAEDDKQFIGYLKPRYKLGLGNDFTFLQNWTASIFLRADLGHIGEESGALNSGAESNDRRARNVGPLPYWTPENPINDYARLDLHTGGYGGGIKIYRSRSFMRIQDITLSYNVPSSIIERVGLEGIRVFASTRNILTISKWPNWDPETGTTPLAKTFNLGLNLSL
ncbi:SusC/RagA family TonB-linked outer membrane protein [Membranihabitans marinus]|uniref:SusC/RagA family TonB-linked outer membrane protein n=1 Tax=Membranihabitans marinus TaxID=1227546 RepID=UPI001F026705|nr:SusC/RagA family TonB-linked outer membrane protein [Membranihabitans marinus]